MYNTICVTEITTRKQKTGCGSAWLERLVWDQEVAGSNPPRLVRTTENRIVLSVLSWTSIVR